jgi:hypothetical protein
MSDATIYHDEHDGTLIEVFYPENLQFTLNKGENGPHDISYEVSRSALLSPDSVGPYRTDFRLNLSTSTDDPVVIMGGMHTMVSVASDQEMVQFAGKDWLHYLERRYWPYDDTDPNAYRAGHTPSFPTTAGSGLEGDPLNDPPANLAYAVSFDVEALDSMTIIKEMLDVVLAQPNSLDITYSLSPIGHIPIYFTIDLISTETILSKIQGLSQEDPGLFDFWIDYNKHLHVVSGNQYPSGVVSDASLAEHTFDTTNPSSGIFTVSWTNTGPEQTRLIATGSNPSSSLAVVREYTPASDVFRLLEKNQNFDMTFEKYELRNRARKAELYGLNPVHEVTLSVLPESVSDFWTKFRPGKAIWIYADLEVHTIDAAFEIVSMDFSSDSSGNEVVNFRLNQIYASMFLDVDPS